MGYMQGEVRTNMQVLKPSHKRLVAGDVFRVGLPDASFIFGRVIRVDLPRESAPVPGANLVYGYRQRIDSSEPDLAALTPDELLIPPLFINRLPWSRGYFETVLHLPLKRTDLLAQLCFRRSNGTYLDENGEPLRAERQPCGTWGLNSFRTFDDEISEALRIPLVSE